MTNIPPLPAHYRVLRLEDADWAEIDHNARPLSVAVRNGVGVHYLLTIERPEDVKRLWPDVRPMIPPDIDPGEIHRPNVSLALHCHTPPTLEQIEAMQRLSGLCHSLWLAGSPKEKWDLRSWLSMYDRDVPFAGLLLLLEEWTEWQVHCTDNREHPKRYKTDPAHLFDLYEQAQACGMECYLGGEA